MKVADLVAWSETLGVSIDEVPTVLRFRVRQINALREDVVKAWGGLRNAPDEELVLQLAVAGRVLGEVVQSLETSVAEAGKVAV
jgi:hypothetical protein